MMAATEPWKCGWAQSGSGVSVEYALESKDLVNKEEKTSIKHLTSN